MKTRGSRRQESDPSSPPHTSTKALAEVDRPVGTTNIEVVSEQETSPGPPVQNFTSDYISIIPDAPDKDDTIGLDGSIEDRKRKRVELHTDNDKDNKLVESQIFSEDASNLASGSNKRTKLDQSHPVNLGADSLASQVVNGPSSSDKSLLPKPIWQHIFSFLPPKDLGSLLIVNKAFHSLLSGPRIEADPISYNKSEHHLVSLEPDVIWRFSRQRFHPHVPKPLDHLSELESWKLVYGRNCQFCRREPEIKPINGVTDPLHAGPGPKGVCIVWPLAIRSCGQCLVRHTERDISLLMSAATPSQLLAGLPIIFLTSEENVILPNVLQSLTLPSNFQMPEKRFFKPHVEAIQRQFEEVRSLGGAAVEEWMKGLEAVGQRRQNDAIRWERWDAKTNTGHVRVLPHVDTVKPSTDSHPTASTSDKAIDTVDSSSPNLNESKSNGFVPTTLPGPPVLPRRIGSIPLPSAAAAAQVPTYIHPQHNSFHQPRVERSLAEVNQAKIARKQEIERRCAEFDPPIPPNVLGQMDSFHAAIQISTPLIDSAWEVLKPRLIAQRELGEERERARIAAEKAAEVRLEEKKQEEAMLKQAKENADRDWDEKQHPIRETLGKIADDFVKSSWDDGKAVTRDNCTKFAADALLYIRRCFLDQTVTEDDGDRAADQPLEENLKSDSPARKLILENMKWVFDTKIKPWTEPFRKELFLCHNCDGNTKYYGFEGVIQHFAAKHTNQLSVGSIVVHWRAEWPDHSPFHPDPSSVKPIHLASGHPQNSQLHGHNGYYHSPNSGHYTTPATAQNYPPAGIDPYHESYSAGARPLSRYQDRHAGYLPDTPVYETAYSRHQYEPTRYHGQPAQYPPGAGYPDYHPDGHGLSSRHTYPGSVSERGHSMPFGTAGHRDAYPPHIPEPPRNMPRHPGAIEAATTKIGPPSDLHTFKQHLEVMAAFAREIWTTMGGVKDMPIGVKIYVLIYHVATRVRSRYGYEPGLEMFTEGVEHQHLMRPIKHASGAISCRTCLADTRDPRFAQYGQPNPSDSVYQFPMLLGHFKAIHVDRMEQPMYGYPVQVPDWKQDMVALPEEAVVSALINAPGMDDQKLRLLAEAFPPSFPNPLPRIGMPNSAGPSILPSKNGYNTIQDHSFPDSARYDPHPTVSADVRYNEDAVEAQHYAESNYVSASTTYGSSQPTTSKPQIYRDSARSSNITEGRLSIGEHSAHQIPPMTNNPREMREFKVGADVEMEREPSYDPRHSDLVFAPKAIQTDTSSRPQSSRRRHDTQGLEEGSEDGEVGPISGTLGTIDRNDPRPKVQSAANEFLQKFDKNGAHSEYMPSQSDRRADSTARRSWLGVQDTNGRSSRISDESRDEYARSVHDGRVGESSYNHAPVYRDERWNENDNSAVAASAPVKYYNAEERPPRNLRTAIPADQFAEYSEKPSARPYQARSQEFMDDSGEMGISHDGHYQAETASHQQYRGRQDRSPHKSTTLSSEAHTGWRHSREVDPGHFRSDPPARVSPNTASYVPDDLKNSLQVPAQAKERVYVDNPRHSSSHRNEYVRVPPNTEHSQGAYVAGSQVHRASSNTYTRHENTRGAPIYVEQNPAYQSDVRLYEREDPRFGSRRVRYG